jgi:hypothetical protein
LRLKGEREKDQQYSERLHVMRRHWQFERHAHWSF